MAEHQAYILTVPGSNPGTPTILNKQSIKLNCERSEAIKVLEERSDERFLYLDGSRFELTHPDYTKP